MRTIAENPADSMTSWRFVVAALFVIAGASVAAVLSDSEPAGADPQTCTFDPISGQQCWHNDHPPECPDGTTGTPPNCTPFEYDDPDQDDDDDDVDDVRVYSPDDTETGRCGGGSTEDTDANGNTVCRRWTTDGVRGRRRQHPGAMQPTPRGGPHRDVPCGGPARMP